MGKLSQIKSKLGPRRNPGLKRWDSVIYTRLKLGHTFLTHSYLLTREEKPFCEGCNENFTVKHILLDCIDFSDIREKYYGVKNMKALFDAIEPKAIINFIKQIGLYNLYNKRIEFICLSVYLSFCEDVVPSELRNQST